MIKVELTEREFECLLGHMEVDKEIFEEIQETEPSDDPNDYTNVMVGLIKKFREIKNTSI
jgi:hypothetical protein